MEITPQTDILVYLKCLITVSLLIVQEQQNMVVHLE